MIMAISQINEWRSPRYLEIMAFLVRFKNERHMDTKELLHYLRMAEEQFKAKSRECKRDAQQLTITDLIPCDDII